MASSYPGALDSFTTKTDNVDAILASHVNDLQNSVVAIQTELGTNPSAGFSDVTARLLTYDNVNTHRIQKFISNPQAVFAQRAQIVFQRADAALTITRIHLHCSDLSPTAELAGDLKFADDVNAGGFANATVIDVCDTTSGVFTATSSFDDATVPSGKYIYFQLDSSPHADITDVYLEYFYTYD